MVDPRRQTALELAKPTLELADIDTARKERRMALSLRTSADLLGSEVRHLAVKIVFSDGASQTLLFDEASARVLGEAVAQLNALGWRVDALRPTGREH